MQSAEAAVAHHEHLVPGQGFRGQFLHQRIDRARQAHPRLQRRDRRGQIEAQPGAFKNQVRSASASAGASCSRCTPSFIVLERGSTTATIRASGAPARRPRSVVSIAVG